MNINNTFIKKIRSADVIYLIVLSFVTLLFKSVHTSSTTHLFQTDTWNTLRIPKGVMKYEIWKVFMPLPAFHQPKSTTLNFILPKIWKSACFVVLDVLSKTQKQLIHGKTINKMDNKSEKVCIHSMEAITRAMSPICSAWTFQWPPCCWKWPYMDLALWTSSKHRRTIQIPVREFHDIVFQMLMVSVQTLRNRYNFVVE
jgi:hypothetical protein